MYIVEAFSEKSPKSVKLDFRGDGKQIDDLV